MLKRFLILLVICAVGAATVAWLRGSGPADAPGADDAVVEIIRAQVFVKTSGGEFKEITASQSVAAGTGIKTSADGQAIIRYPNGIVTVINENSEIRIQEFASGGDSSIIKLISGSILSKVKNLLGTGQTSYQIQTDHIVASVRGTVFATSVVDGRSAVYGIEGRVRARRPTQKEQEGADVTSGRKVLADSKVVAAITASVEMTLDDYRKDFISRAVVDRVEATDVREEQKPNVERFLEKIKDVNTDRQEIRDKAEKRIKELRGSKASPSASPTASASPRPTASPTPKPSSTPLPSVTIIPTATPTPVPVSTPTPTPTPPLVPTLEFISPKIISSGQTTSLNGSNFLGSRSLKQISTVTIGGQSIGFGIIDPSTIITDPIQLAPGKYDVTVVTTAGAQLTLPDALTIQ